MSHWDWPRDWPRDPGMYPPTQVATAARESPLAAWLPARHQPTLHRWTIGIRGVPFDLLFQTRSLTPIGFACLPAV
jgi:hypothetical protein